MITETVTTGRQSWQTGSVTEAYTQMPRYRCFHFWSFFVVNFVWVSIFGDHIDLLF